jgi:uncharacterized membrane protein
MFECWEANKLTRGFGRRMLHTVGFEICFLVVLLMNQFRGYMKNAVSLDWDTINTVRPEWNNRWSRTIEK